MIDQIGGRKLIAGVVVLALGVGAVLLLGDIPPNLLQLLSIVFGAFVVGNVGEHISGAFSSKAAVVEQQVTAITDPAVTAQLEELKSMAATNAEAVTVVQQALSMIISKYGIDRS